MVLVGKNILGTQQDDFSDRDPVVTEIDKAFQELIKEAKEQGGMRSDLSEEAIILYLSFFQQGISNTIVREKIRHNPKLSDDLLTLFMYGVTGSPAKITE
jgi:hypothetical protein